MNKLKRFIVFAFEHEDFGGGWDNFIASFDTLEEAQEWCPLEELCYDWIQIVDSETSELVSQKNAKRK
jgi:hypothetical protein